LVIRDIGIRKQLEKELLASLDKVRRTENAAILALAKLSEFREVTPGHHLERIREYCRLLATELAVRSELQDLITPEYILNLYQGVILHDIGKVAIADEILLKKGALTSREEEILRHHAVTGGSVIKAMEEEAQGSGFLSLAKNIAYFHHERWDGKGYPFGLKGEAIPLEARIMAVADAYEEVTATIEPEKMLTHQQAVEWIVSSAGHQLDPMIVEVFVRRQEEFERLRGSLAEKA
jgi:response regulator RpfG family c-di-GMP phosphodiesterase